MSEKLCLFGTTACSSVRRWQVAAEREMLALSVAVPCKYLFLKSVHSSREFRSSSYFVKIVVRAATKVRLSISEIS